MSTFTAPSGAEVVINIASWEEANRLKKAIERVIGTSQTLHPLQLIALVDSSDDVEKAVWPCLSRCLRDGQKVVPMTFDNAESRKDYLSIVEACVKENLGPLVESLRLRLSEMGIAIPQASANPPTASASPSNSPSSTSQTTAS